MHRREAAELTVTWSRAWSAAALVVLGGLTAVAAAMALASDPGPARAGSAVLASLLALGALRSAWLAWSPPILFAAGPAGITTYLRGQRYGGPGFVVPWSAIVSMDLETRHLQPGNLRCKTVAVRVAAPLAVPAEASYRGAGAPQVLHLDARSGSLRGDALLAALRELEDRFGGRAGATPP